MFLPLKLWLIAGESGVCARLVHPQLRGAAWFVTAWRGLLHARLSRQGAGHWQVPTACQTLYLQSLSALSLKMGVSFTWLIETSLYFPDLVCMEHKTPSREGAGALSQGSRQLWHSVLGAGSQQEMRWISGVVAFYGNVLFFTWLRCFCETKKCHQASCL